MIHKNFLNLIGTWEIDKKITNIAFAVGKVDFIYKNNCSLLYKEFGTIYWNNNKSNKFYNEYIFEYDFYNKSIIVLFNNLEKKNKVFLTLNFKGNQKSAQATHLCNQDTYFANFNYISQLEFKIAYKVDGPKKNYLINNHYKKLNN